jgi:predicted SnoaL-like aldol condensation-catalyzing enzyme
MSEENKAVMRRIYEEFWNEGNFEALDEIVSPDYVLHVPTPPGAPSGREGLQWVIQMYRAAFPFGERIKVNSCTFRPPTRK